MTGTEFRDLYEAYIGAVSPSAMALSWESLTAIDRWLQKERPKRMVEYGTGISTAMLSNFAGESGGRVESFDSDPEWALRTKEFLVEHGLAGAVEISVAGEVIPLEPAPFVLWDFDKNPRRVVLMADAFANVAPGGLLYVDDMHNGEIAAACAELEGETVDETCKDGFGRYGVFVRKQIA